MLGRDDESAERQEFGLHDRGEAEVKRERSDGVFLTDVGSETAQDDLEDMRAPRDEAP